MKFDWILKRMDEKLKDSPRIGCQVKSHTFGYKSLVSILNIHRWQVEREKMLDEFWHKWIPLTLHTAITFARSKQITSALAHWKRQKFLYNLVYLNQAKTNFEFLLTYPLVEFKLNHFKTLEQGLLLWRGEYMHYITGSIYNHWTSSDPI